VCGILGLYSQNACQYDEVKNKFDLAKEIGKHRGPDGYGFFNNESQNIFLAHHRLSIIDPTSSSNQPMMDDNEENIMIFNGEIYNYKELREELIKENKFEFKTNSDSEVLLKFFISNLKKDNFDFLNKLRGIFAALIYSKSLNKIFIFNDRFAVKPLYIYENEKYSLFGSEIKSFIPFIDKKLNININSIKNYLIYIYAPGDYTPVNEITSPVLKVSFAPLSAARPMVTPTPAIELSTYALIDC